MGEEVELVRFTPEHRQRYREKVRRCLDALRQMVEQDRFGPHRDRIGLELEIYLVDRDGIPMMINTEVLNRIESAAFQTELAQFNIEFNLPAHEVEAGVFRTLEDELLGCLGHALMRAAELDARIVIVGILPTLRDLHVTRENLTRNPRYQLLNEQILAARGENLQIDIAGAERLTLSMPSIALEAASTSMQLHIQVDPQLFARHWNAAAAISAPQLAVGCNSPFLLGRQLWQETRIALFEQSTDTRTAELAAQGVRPRVWFGERWIEGAVDLFEENVRYFPALLPILDEEDPFAVLDQGGTPRLRELTLLNGTIWRWNRPVYGVTNGHAHLRLENRVLPAGPSVVDAIANAVFYYGLLRTIAADEPPISERLLFGVANDNFFSAARDGIDSELLWPGHEPLPACELVLRHLLPLAHAGLESWDIDPLDRARYLGIIEGRCLSRRTGATWQVATFRNLHEGCGLGRRDALLEMTRRYLEFMEANEPVHTWPVA
ncbi:MAG: glutamate--cysteine ligase [Actinomycetota bacterium]|nr:glutamate--cysteine ligase [Actinomycetota bacterium]